jgi:hypothetical protein
VSDQITAGLEHLLDQASNTAHHYFLDAIADIDRSFGAGYAAKHPELVAAYMNVCVKDLANSSTLLVWQGIFRRLTEEISDSLEDRREKGD